MAPSQVSLTTCLGVGQPTLRSTELDMMRCGPVCASYQQFQCLTRLQQHMISSKLSDAILGDFRLYCHHVSLIPCAFNM